MYNVMSSRSFPTAPQGSPFCPLLIKGGDQEGWKLSWHGPPSAAQRTVSSSVEVVTGSCRSRLGGTAPPLGAGGSGLTSCSATFLIAAVSIMLPTSGTHQGSQTSLVFEKAQPMFTLLTFVNRVRSAALGSKLAPSSHLLNE